MEKKIYLRPLATEELFTPNEYCSACRDAENQRVWEAQCRTTAEGSCLIFFDEPEDTNGQWTSDACRGGCGGTHQFTGSAIPTPNCYLLVKVRDGSGAGSSNISQYKSWFSDISSGSHGAGYKLNSELVDDLIRDGELVRGYYNSNILGDHRWLVTEHTADIHPLFS